MKIEEMGLLTGTVSPADIRLAEKLNEVIRAFNGLYDAVEALSHSIPAKAPTSPTPEEMGYIKLDEDSLRRFHESKEGQELGRRYNQIVTDRIKLDPTITAEELAEDRAKLQMQVENYNREKGMAHLTTAFENLKRIAFGENPEGKEEYRINPETKDWNTVRYLAEIAINEFETFIKQGGQNNDK